MTMIPSSRRPLQLIVHQAADDPYLKVKKIATMSSTSLELDRSTFMNLPDPGETPCVQFLCICTVAVAMRSRIAANGHPLLAILAGSYAQAGPLLTIVVVAGTIVGLQDSTL